MSRRKVQGEALAWAGGFLSVSAIAGALVYITVRSVLLAYSNPTPLERSLAVLLITAESFIAVHGIGYAINILRVLRLAYTPVSSRALSPDEMPSVAVLVAARHEPKNVLENTFLTINNMDYANKKVYFLDDSSDELYWRQAEEICREYDLTLFRRTAPRHGAKAGIINDCLKTISEEYVVVFDADQNPLPDFLKVLVPVLKKDNKLAFVQAPQVYSNIGFNPVARGAAFQQAVFYEYICEGKSVSDSAFCCGTNVIFRAAALRDVGGFSEWTVTEDFATSLKLHSKGWRSLYYPHVYAFGMGPENLSAYFRQQFRWAAGTLSVFKLALWKLLSSPRSLSLGQWAEYFLSGSYYLVGGAFYVLMLCPIGYIFFGIPSFFAVPEIYLLVFLPYVLLSMTVFYSVLRKRNYRKSDLFLGQMLGVISCSVYLRAALAAFSGIKVSFGITSKAKGRAVPYFRLWPQIFVLALNFTALVWGINRYFYELDPAVLTNCFWAGYHSVLFSSVFYFNRES